MQNPFPGMNPYLEQPELWHQVHNRLIVALADELTPQIVPNYRVAIEERIYSSVADSLLVGVADISVSRRDISESTATLVTPTLTQPTKVIVPVPEEVTERYLEVRSTQTNQVITVIEILSPKNKRSGGRREAYESKRQRILASTTNFVEIDLLRAGESMPILGAIRKDYCILVCRCDRRPEADLYTFGIQEKIPPFPIPLKKHDQEPIIDLQKLLNEVYTRARFDLAIDYSIPLKSSLSSENKAWLQTIVGAI
jgi:Protein of unknown function (DUF4058)